jgi:hypothetical protein
MSIILSRLLLVVLLLVNLESISNLERGAVFHGEDGAAYFHGEDGSFLFHLDDPVQSDRDSDEENHCSHCFHHHATGVLAHSSNNFDMDSEPLNISHTVHFDSNLTSPPTPPPNTRV